MRRGGGSRGGSRSTTALTGHRVNRQIRAREVQLIDADGNNHGKVPIQEALKLAEEAGLDLVEVAKTADPPVCRVMDYGKLVYQAKKKKTHSKAATALKEMSFSMKIGPHDIETKMRKAREFLDKGHKLRINLILRGRERAYANTKGKAQLDRLCAMLDDAGTVEQRSRGMVGNRMSAILAPRRD
jgi:translation initiation factor IF-3